MAKTRQRPTTWEDGVFQFKITLLGAEPPVWRRIQVTDCTVDDLHYHIQTAMGWENSHLHEFFIGHVRFGDPGLLDDDFGDQDVCDSRSVRLGELLARRRKGFRIRYVYDFGDYWEHEIQYEGRLTVEPKAKYPQCLDGARACPPEDVGGVWGYAELIEALADPQQEGAEQLLDWAGDFDPDDFSPKSTTRAMRKGIPNWRSLL